MMKLVPIRSRGGLKDEWTLADHATYTIGRHDPGTPETPDIDIALDHRVSRHHAKISFENGTCWLEDLGSKHGTWVDGANIATTGRVKLALDAEIKFGDTTFTVAPSYRRHIAFRNLIVEIDAAEAINYSLIHSGIPFVSRVAVRNIGSKPATSVRLRFSIAGIASSDEIVFDQIDAGRTKTVFNPTIHTDQTSMESQIEGKTSAMTLTVNDQPITEVEITILAHNEWSQEEHHRLALASFVLPNHPYIRQVETEAREYLDKSQTFHHLVHSGDEQAPWSVIKAFYNYFQFRWKLDYRHENPGYTPNSQRIRLAEQVLENLLSNVGSGTCVDLVLLVAACLEYVGAQPLVVLLETSPGQQHALLGCWKNQVRRYLPFVDSKEIIQNDAILFDCTGFARMQRSGGKGVSTLDVVEAHEVAAKLIREGRFLYALDVLGARSEGVHPLPYVGQPHHSASVSDALLCAMEFAQSLGTPYCGTVHLLLAFISVETSTMCQVLRQLSVNPDLARKKLDAGLLAQRAEDVSDLRRSDNLDAVVSEATRLAKRDGSTLVLEEHVLLALAQSKSTALKDALAGIGTDTHRFNSAIFSSCQASKGGVRSYSVFSQFPLASPELDHDKPMKALTPTLQMKDPMIDNPQIMQKGTIVPDDLITVETVSKEGLKSIFDSAFMNASYDNNENLVLDELIRCFVVPDKERRRIRLIAYFGLNPHADEKAKLACANRINSAYILVRACISDDGTALVFDYDISLDGGLTKKALVMVTKRFCTIPRPAIADYGKEIV